MAYHPDWLSLNYYKQVNGQWESDIQNIDFFISAEGRSNPLIEWNSFDALVKKSLIDKKSRKKVCRYPARLHFYFEYNSLDSLHFVGQKNALCEGTEFDKIITETSSVSIVFIDGYFGNPASYFGHLLLMFHDDLMKDKNTLLNTSINYGALIDSDDALSYAFKGIFGGYYASYKPYKFFTQDLQYADHQDRDIWIYELNLSEKKSKNIVRQSLELGNAKFAYYFINDNCSHRISHLLEKSVPTLSLNRNNLWMFPIEVIRNISKERLPDHTKLLKKIHYLPSEKRLFLNQVGKLSTDEQEVLLNFLKTGESFKEGENTRQKKELLILADRYLKRKIIQSNHRKDKELNDFNQADYLRRKVLLDLVELQKIPITSSLIAIPKYPHLNTKNGSAIGFSKVYDHHSNEKSFDMTFRLAYTDVFSSDIAKSPNSTLSMGKLKLNLKNSTIKVREFTLFELKKLYTTRLDWMFFSDMLWNIKLGIGRLDSNRIRLFPYFKIGVGTGRKIEGHALFYTIFNLYISNNKEKLFPIISPMIESGVIGNFLFKSKYGFQANYFLNKEGKISDKYSGFIRKSASDQLDILIEYKKVFKESFVSLGIIKYF